jgi:hypothetical protein
MCKIGAQLQKCRQWIETNLLGWPCTLPLLHYPPHRTASRSAGAARLLRESTKHERHPDVLQVLPGTPLHRSLLRTDKCK